ncbi:MAG: hypothetical protein K0Q53_1287 [Massilibacillus sp.]|jgi:hypothetical protein|nr:hypothetical protein [Massilibacillus sp.]
MNLLVQSIGALSFLYYRKTDNLQWKQTSRQETNLKLVYIQRPQ